MKEYGVADIRALVATRKETTDLVVLALEIETDTVHFLVTLLFRFWPQYKTYIAVPVDVSGDMVCSVALSMPDEWQRYLKRKIKHMFGVRHFHNVNPPQNQSRINALLGVTYI